jgi:hypothetical protein
MITTFEILIAFAEGAAAGCAAAAIALAGREHKPPYLSPVGELTTYGWAAAHDSAAVLPSTAPL